jgi:hypothetical protein
MVVAPRVREIENEIDSKVRALKIWQRPKQAVLADIMQAYRDSIEVVFAECLFFQLHAEHDRAAAGGIGVVRAQENRWRAGTLWALKWASEFCLEDGGTGSSRPEELADLLTLGAMYETFVDALKRANHGSRDWARPKGRRVPSERATHRSRLHQHRQRHLRRLPSTQDRLDDIWRQRGQSEHATHIGRIDLLGGGALFDGRVRATLLRLPPLERQGDRLDHPPRQGDRSVWTMTTCANKS